ncbi:MAG: complex I NDUFA9 subunit family protein [Parvularculaceae bacterium]|nr:complex I NDUFA9 subunit family protein [Parvularculaceae bacterium]
MVGELAVVFGGSGFVGRNVVRELAKRGWRVRVAVRRPHHAQFLRPMGAVGQIQLAQANLRDRRSVAEALKGADAVVNCVGILYESGPQSFAAVQAAGAATIAELAAAEGVRRFVQISAIGADAEGESQYARSKAEGEAAVRAAIPTATILRPSIIFGPEDGFFNRFAAMAAAAPALPLIGGGETEFQPVYVDDVADAVAAALERPEAAGAVYELGGPRVYSFRALMELTLAVIGRKRLLAPIPFGVASLMGLAGEVAGFLPFMKPPITRDQVTLLKYPNVVAAGARGLGDLGIAPTSVEAIVPTYLYRYRKYGQFAERPAG